MHNEALLAEPRFATNAERARHMEEVDALVRSWSQQFTRAELTVLLNEAGVPCGPVLTLEEVADDAHLKQRQIIVEIAHPMKGPVKVIGCPLKFSTADGALQIDVLPAPGIGQHNEEVYTSLLGYTPADLERWRAEDIIYAAHGEQASIAPPGVLKAGAAFWTPCSVGGTKAYHTERYTHDNHRLRRR